MKPAILRELVEAAQRGDRAHFDRLFDLWFSAVYLTAMRRVGGNHARAEALTQRFLVGAIRIALDPPAASATEGESTNAQPGDTALR